MKRLILSLALLIGVANFQLSTFNFQLNLASAQRTPTMGWSSWNTYGIDINEALIRRQAEAMVDKGLNEVGYRYVNIDDGYFGGRDADGHLLIHPTRFPNGLKGIVDYIHSLGLKAGIYSDAGRSTCANYFGGDTISHDVGLLDHDQEDCDLFFRELEFDFIKVDFCGGYYRNNALHLSLDPQERYTAISQAIRRTGRDVVFNVCRWEYPGNWVQGVADSWRISHDIYQTWDNVSDIINQSLYLSAYCYDGHYNDMDMLEVGRGLTTEEDKTHFALWCIMSSPLLIGCDMSTLKGATLTLLKNEELIALNQDPLHLQAQVVGKVNGCYILVKDIAERQDTRRAVAIYNPTDAAKTVKLRFADVCLDGEVQVRDLFTHRDLGGKTESYTVSVPTHGTRVYMLDGERRLEQTRYEAENAYIGAYQELVNNQSAKTGIYSGNQSSCSGEAKAGWLGQSAENDLQWRDVYSQTGGEYTLTVGLITGESRRVNIDVNGQPVATLTANTGGWDKVGTEGVTIQLRKGFNTIRLHNATAWMPDIDYIDLKRNDNTAISIPSSPASPAGRAYTLAGTPAGTHDHLVVQDGRVRLR